MNIPYLAAQISEPVLDSIGQISSGKDSRFPSSMNEKTKPETLQLEKFCPRARPSEKVYFISPSFNKVKNGQYSLGKHGWISSGGKMEKKHFFLFLIHEKH